MLRKLRQRNFCYFEIEFTIIYSQVLSLFLQVSVRLKKKLSLFIKEMSEPITAFYIDFLII